MKDNLEKSFSEEGQDIILKSIFRNVEIGTYLDIGSFKPEYLSNTYKLYLAGWRGVCIDGNPSLKRIWAEKRPEDIFINSFLADKKKSVTYSIFPNEFETMNSIDPQTSLKYSRRFEKNEIRKESRDAEGINEILNKYFNNKELHLICCDAEGSELNIFEAIDFDKFLPGAILVEVKNFNFSSFKKDKLVSLLYKKGYKLFCKTPLDCFFVHPSKKYIEWIPREILN